MARKDYYTGKAVPTELAEEFLRRQGYEPDRYLGVGTYSRGGKVRVFLDEEGYQLFVGRRLDNKELEAGSTKPKPSAWPKKNPKSAKELMLAIDRWTAGNPLEWYDFLYFLAIVDNASAHEPDEWSSRVSGSPKGHPFIPRILHRSFMEFADQMEEEVGGETWTDWLFQGTGIRGNSQKAFRVSAESTPAGGGSGPALGQFIYLFCNDEGLFWETIEVSALFWPGGIERCHDCDRPIFYDGLRWEHVYPARPCFLISEPADVFPATEDVLWLLTQYEKKMT